MVGNVGRVPRPRLTNEAPQQACERLRVQLGRLSPGHPSLLLPFDAFLWDILEDSIAEVERNRAAKQPKQTAMTERQQTKAFELKQRIHRKWMEWREARNECRKIANSKSQNLMRLLPVNWSDEVLPISLNVSDALIYSSFEQGKRENDKLEFSLWELEGRVAAMTDALRFANEPPEEQARLMALALFDDFQALTERVRQLEAALRETNKPKRKVAA